MFEKIETINLDRPKEEKPLETINELSIHETDLLEKAQEKIPEEKRGKFKKMKKAFLAITAGAMLLGATGCGVPFMIGAEAKNMKSVSTTEVILGPVAYPIEILEDAFERENDSMYFYNDKIALELWYKKPFFNDEQINRIVDDFRKKGWMETENNYGNSKIIGRLSVIKNNDETFDICTRVDSVHIKSMTEIIYRKSIQEKDLMKNIKEIISTIEKDKKSMNE